MESIIKPYVLHNGVWSISDEMMVIIYHFMEQSKLLGDVFKSGEIKDPNSWMNFVKNRSNVVHILRSSRDYPADMIAWLNGWGYNYAFGHFCCFPHTWGGEAIELGHKTVNYWFDELRNDNWQLEAIFGQIPSTNKRAINYVMRLGFRKLGDVPSVRYKDDKKAKGATLFVKER